MNARTIQRVLMRNRSRSFWGRRAFVTVHCSDSIFPVPRPTFYPPWPDIVEHGFGYWVTGDGALYGIGQVHGQASLMQADALFPEQDGSWWMWWIGTCRHADGTEVPLASEIVTAYRAEWEWDRHWTIGYDGFTGVPAVDALLGVGAHAKTSYSTFRDGRWWLTYSVKWFYPDTKRAFCAALARTLEAFPAIRLVKGRAI